MISPESPLVTWAIVGLFKAFTMVLGGERFEIERLMRKNVALGLEVVAVRRQLAAAQAQSAKPKAPARPANPSLGDRRLQRQLKAVGTRRRKEIWRGGATPKPAPRTPWPSPRATTASFVPLLTVPRAGQTSSVLKQTAGEIIFRHTPGNPCSPL